MAWIQANWPIVMAFGYLWYLAGHIDKQKEEIRSLRERVYELEEAQRHATMPNWE